MLNHFRSILWADNTISEADRRAYHLCLADETMEEIVDSPFQEIQEILFPTDISNEERLYRLLSYETLLRMAGLEYVLDLFDTRRTYTLADLEGDYSIFTGRLTRHSGSTPDIVVNNGNQTKQATRFSYLSITLSGGTLTVTEYDSTWTTAGDVIYNATVTIGQSVTLTGYGITLTMPNDVTAARTWRYIAGSAISFDVLDVYRALKSSADIGALMDCEYEDIASATDMLWQYSWNPARALAGFIVSYVLRLQHKYYPKT